MAFPSSPSNGQYAVVNNIGYVYNSTSNAWTRAGTTGTTILVTSATFINGGATGSIPYQIAAGQTGFIAAATTSGWVLTSNGTTSSFAPASGGTSIAMVNNTTTSALQYITFASTSTGTLSTLQTAIPGTAGPGLTFQPTTGYVGIGTSTNLTSALFITSPSYGPQNYGPKITLDGFVNYATGIDMQINFGSSFGFSTSTVAFDFYGNQFGGNNTPGPGPGRGQGSWGLNFVSGRGNFSNFWFRDNNYNVLASIVNNGTFVTGYNYQSYSFAPSYSALIQGSVGIGTTVTNAALTVSGGGTITGVFTSTNATNATTTATGALVVLGGIGVGGSVYANQVVAANQTGGANTNIDLRALNGNWSVNFLSRTSAGAYNPLTQQDDSVLYFTNGSQGFGNLVIAPWSSTSTGIRITNTGSVFIPSTTVSTTPNTGALVVTGGIYSAGQSWINPGGDAQTRALGLTIAGNPSANYVASADPGDGLRTLSVIGVTSGRPVILSLRNIANSGFWDLVHDPLTTKLYFQYTGSGYYAMSISNTGTVFVNSNTNSVSTNSGALQVAGGIGVGGSVYVGNRVGFVNNVNVSAVYQVYNTATQSLDTIFG